MSNINKNVLILEGFQYATSLYLNMGYYNIRLTADANSLCMIIIPWKKYSYKYIPMGVANSSEIFQQKINNWFQGFELIRVYINDLLILKKR